MIRVDENNNEEILCATKEMISLLNDKNNTYKYISTRQKKFWKEYKKMHKEKNINLHKKIYTKLPECFLKENDWII